MLICLIIHAILSLWDNVCSILRTRWALLVTHPSILRLEPSGSGFSNECMSIPFSSIFFHNFQSISSLLVSVVSAESTRPFLLCQTLFVLPGNFALFFPRFLGTFAGLSCEAFCIRNSHQQNTNKYFRCVFFRSSRAGIISKVVGGQCG